MQTLLKIQSSLFGSNGQSTQLADRFIAQWLDTHSNGQVVTRDLAAEPIPHLTAERFQALNSKADERTPTQQTVVNEADQLIAELKNAEVVVLAVPMYNFSVPSTLRAYFDHIARAGVTFKYTAAGPQGLLQGKQAFVFITRGSALAPESDTQSAYLRQFLGFIGITDVRFIYAEGLAISTESRERSLNSARQAIATLVPIALAAA